MQFIPHQIIHHTIRGCKEKRLAQNSAAGSEFIDKFFWSQYQAVLHYS